MFSIKLGEKESAASLINRVLDLHAALESLGRPFHEIHIVAAIKKALGANVGYKQTMQTLTAVGGHLTLKALQNAFNSGLSAVTVPGAFYVDHCDDDAPGNPPDSMANLVKEVRTLQNQVKKGQDIQPTT
jgi:hypothetical protein